MLEQPKSRRSCWTSGAVRIASNAYPHRPAPVLAAGSLAGQYDPANLDAVLDDWDEVLAIDRNDLDLLIREVLKRGPNAPGGTVSP